LQYFNKEVLHKLSTNYNKFKINDKYSILDILLFYIIIINDQQKIMRLFKHIKIKFNKINKLLQILQKFLLDIFTCL